MAKITVDGAEYRVNENLGYNHSRGCYAKVVQYGDREKIAISYSAKGPWRWNKPLVQFIGPIVGQSPDTREGE